MNCPGEVPFSKAPPEVDITLPGAEKREPVYIIIVWSFKTAKSNKNELYKKCAEYKNNLLVPFPYMLILLACMSSEPTIRSPPPVTEPKIVKLVATENVTPWPYEKLSSFKYFLFK